MFSVARFDSNTIFYNMFKNQFTYYSAQKLQNIIYIIIYYSYCDLDAGKYKKY